MEKLDTGKKSLKKFGITMAIALLVISGILFLKNKDASYPVIISVLFLSLGLIAPSTLRLTYIIWMKFALILGWINTRLILIIMFYLIFTPIGLIMRIFRTDLLERKLEKSKTSYWKAHQEKEFALENYERQF